MIFGQACSSQHERQLAEFDKLRKQNALKLPAELRLDSIRYCKEGILDTRTGYEMPALEEDSFITEYYGDEKMPNFQKELSWKITSNRTELFNEIDIYYNKSNPDYIIRLINYLPIRLGHFVCRDSTPTGQLLKRVGVGWNEGCLPEEHNARFHLPRMYPECLDCTKVQLHIRDFQRQLYNPK